MRPMVNGQEVGGGNLIQKQSLADVKELWDAWEIHCLVLVSLFLQVFLFLFAGMRQRSASLALRTVLWLAYLSAEAVAIFVLGHVAVQAGEPGQQLMSFWAPFMLVHLGGQDTITAFSKQDNELWTRHLLSLVTQVAVAGYVVAKQASWPDRRLRAATVIMLLSGCFKYAERTFCLYRASPGMLTSKSLGNLSRTVEQMQEEQLHERSGRYNMRGTLERMLEGSRGWEKQIRQRWITESVDEIMSVDAPLNEVHNISLAANDALPDMLDKFMADEHRRGAYELVGACLVHCYQRLYTKDPLRGVFFRSLFRRWWSCWPRSGYALFDPLCCKIKSRMLLLEAWSLFSYVSTAIALGLFAAAEKEGKLHSSSRANITVSYTLLAGALVLDVASATISIFHYLSFAPPSSCMPAWSRKQWSGELAQYSIIKRHAAQDTMRQRIGKLLGAELFDTTYTPIAEDHAPIKKYILDSLLGSGTRREWDIASTRGRLALHKWMEERVLRQDYPALYESTSSAVEFPTSVLIWHIATEICYYCGDNKLRQATATTSSDQVKEHKQVSRELSNYIMYLVFKCGVRLTSNSQLVHRKAHDEISRVLSEPRQEAAAVVKLFEVIKDKQQRHHSTADNKNLVQKLLKSTLEAIDSPVLPHAGAVAQELDSIPNEAVRWGLIASVWSEMLYFAAPRCGGAFHYERLTTGGEFITHVLLLMRFLGPFLPAPGT